MNQSANTSGIDLAEVNSTINIKYKVTGDFQSKQVQGKQIQFLSNRQVQEQAKVMITRGA